MPGPTSLKRRYYAISETLKLSAHSPADILEAAALGKIHLYLNSGLLTQVQGKWMRVLPETAEQTLRVLPYADDPLDAMLEPNEKYTYQRLVSDAGFDDYTGRSYDKMLSYCATVRNLWISKDDLKKLVDGNQKKYDFRNWLMGEQRIILRDDSQVNIVKFLWEHAQRGFPDQHQRKILEASGLPHDKEKRLRDQFAKGKHPAWGVLILPGKERATFRLAEDAQPIED